MKKLILFILSCLSLINISNAQMGINSTGTAPNSSAMLDVSSTTKGLLPPRMTSAQKNAIANPADGLLVFDTNTQSYWFRQSGTWTELPKAGSTSNYWSLSGAGGNEIQNTNSGGFWSANPVGLQQPSNDTSNPPTAPVSGAGTRLMWIPSRSAFRSGTVTGDHATDWDAANIGLYSVAFGFNANASGIVSSALGANTIASGQISTAIGVNTTAFGDRSTAMGSNTFAGGYSSTAMGEGSTASGYNSVAMGYGTVASGIYSLAMGSNTTASGESSVAMGSYTTANGTSSTSLGVGNQAYSNGTLAIGYYNYDPFFVSPSSVNRFLLTIGNGDAVNRRNCFEVRQTGTVQINHYTPTQDNPDRFGLRIKRDVATGNQFWTISHPSNENLDFHYGASGAFKAYVRQTDGAWVQSSDIRLKEQIKPVESVLEKVTQLKVARYFYKTDTLHINQQMGLIAQEVLPLFPEFVTQNGQYYGVNYGGLSVVALKAIQELRDENETLRAMLLNAKKQESEQLKSLKVEIEMIKASLSNSPK
ncbi:trimeric autotransporter adhesin [Arcicella aurantiaca]|uniref:Trimeric autotransporter adhesin n=1 Tax=Arcicella aurantiaca TaxID=591202 RepID=A0A316EXD8_9BACT|nr:tail fiber domain-containing protein [Arcicella aurantiaca]PWK27864.1 trimeric autotransporter adhesin [Arcicella aurantiaca]